MGIDGGEPRSGELESIPARAWVGATQPAGDLLRRPLLLEALLDDRAQAQSPKGPLAAALQEYGRLVKTNFALEYHADPLQQRRITAMLNKGETINTLRRRIAFANRNELRHDADPDQHAACLTLILNAIIVWNTRYIQAALDDIRDPSSSATRPLPTWLWSCMPTSTPTAATTSTSPAHPNPASSAPSTPAPPASRATSRAHRSRLTATNTKRCRTRHCCRYPGLADCEARAAEHGLGPITWPEPWPTLDLLVARAMLYAARCELLKPFSLEAMRMAFREGADLGELAVIEQAGTRVGLDRVELARAAKSEEVKAPLREANDQARALGVYGVPTVAVGSTLFWGDDRLAEAATAIK